MAFNFSPRIVQQGLVLALDAGNVKSYPGSGTAWSDLTGNGNNGILTNGPTFNSGNGGSIVFDGTNDYVLTNGVIPTGNTSKSLFLIFKSTTTISTRQWLFYSGGESGTGRFCLEIESSKFTFNYYNSAIASSTLTSETWYYGGVTYNLSNSNIKIYVNGVNQSTNAIGLSTGFNSNNYIGSYLGTGIYFNGNIPVVQAYDRELSSTEVLQNYNALKGRFGLS